MCCGADMNIKAPRLRRRALIFREGKDILVVQGDWNAKVGKDAQAD